MSQRFYRKKREDVRAISLRTKIYEIISGQTFYETPKAWELWLNDPLMRLMRWPKSRVLWVIPKNEAYTDDRRD